MSKFVLSLSSKRLCDYFCGNGQHSLCPPLHMYCAGIGDVGGISWGNEQTEQQKGNITKQVHT